METNLAQELVGTSAGEEPMAEHLDDMSDEELIDWRKGAVKELARRGWNRSEIATRAGMGSSSSLYHYISKNGVVQGRHGYSLNQFLVAALDAGTPDDYRNACSAVAETPERYPSRERLTQVRNALEYATDLLNDMERELNNGNVKTANAGPQEG